MVIGCYYLTLMVTKSPSMIQKWFGTEKKALSAFYQKKINIHTSILVRYNLQDFKIKIEKEKIELFDLQTKLLTTQKIIKILKIYKLGLENKKYFLITNIGIFIARSKEFNFYELTDLFLETTPGRLIFSTNFKNSINL
jgi:hypothetical protein